MEKEYCWVCGGKDRLTIHHLREVKAKRKGKPNGEIPLCRDCHDLIEYEKVKIKWNKKLSIVRKKAYNRGFEDGLKRSHGGSQ